MACKNPYNPVGDGNNPYAPGNPYGHGGAYCGNCYPYGPGFPSDPNAPTNAECVPDTSDPCAVPQKQTGKCFNGICDDRFQNIPPANRIRLFGADGKCLYQFPHADGVVMSDEQGQFITNRPCLKLPFKKEFVRNPDTGAIILDQNGDPIEDEVPGFDSIIGVDPCGCQNRIQGVKDQRQKIIWDSNQFIFEAEAIRDNNPLLDPGDVPIVDQACNGSMVATLVPTTKEITGGCGELETVSGFKIGGFTNFGSPIGIMHMWPGPPANIPDQYMLADGTSLLIDDWPEAFAAIGYAWGGGGQNFNLPDMRGLIPRGVDIDAGRDPDSAARTAITTGGNTGNNVGSFQDDQMQCFAVEFTKTIVNAETVTTSAGPSQTVGSDVETFVQTDAIIKEDTCGPPKFGDETRPRNIYVNFIIKVGCPQTVV